MPSTITESENWPIKLNLIWNTEYNRVRTGWLKSWRNFWRKRNRRNIPRGSLLYETTRTSLSQRMQTCQISHPRTLQNWQWTTEVFSCPQNIEPSNLTTFVLSSDLLFAKFCQHVAWKHVDMCKDPSLSKAHVENVANTIKQIPRNESRRNRISYIFTTPHKKTTVCNTYCSSARITAFRKNLANDTLCREAARLCILIFAIVNSWRDCNLADTFCILNVFHPNL